MIEQKTWEFNAKWHGPLFPYKKQRSPWKKFFKVLFFPVSWICFFNRKIFQKIFRSKILPSSNYRKKEVRLTAEIFSARWAKNTSPFTPHKLKLYTPDGYCLSGIYYQHKDSSEKTSVVLLFQSNSSLVKHGEYEWLLETCEKRGFVTDFISIDYRGCGESNGKILQATDFILDGDTLYQFVRKMLKKEPSQILFYGHSLGACVSVFIQNLYPTSSFRFVNERSFSSISRLFELRHPKYGKWLAKMAKKTKWELNPAKIWPNLPGEKLVIFQKKDPIVPFEASLFFSIEKDPTTGHIELTAPDHGKKPTFHHSMPLSHYADKKTASCAEELMLCFLFSP